MRASPTSPTTSRSSCASTIAGPITGNRVIDLSVRDRPTARLPWPRRRARAGRICRPRAARRLRRPHAGRHAASGRAGAGAVHGHAGLGEALPCPRSARSPPCAAPSRCRPIDRSRWARRRTSARPVRIDIGASRRRRIDRIAAAGGDERRPRATPTLSAFAPGYDLRLRRDTPPAVMSGRGLY